jgi:hypothetical protein
MARTQKYQMTLNDRPNEPNPQTSQLSDKADAHNAPLDSKAKRRLIEPPFHCLSGLQQTQTLR